MNYKLYTDGSCHGNPGPGGWAFLIHNGETIICKKSGRMNLTTNNQMELSAAIEAINNFKLISSEKTVSIYTDSKYVIDGINSWIHGWKKNNWMTSAKKPVKNVELWKKLDEYAASLIISWHWVKGHSGDVYNDQVDQMANDATNGILIT